jgi:hypothetical protein
MSSLCPSGYTFENGYCYSVCPAGTESIASYPEYCVSTVSCQVGTIPDATGLACTKAEPIGIVPKVTTCASGFTEWTSGLCYVNCNSYFLENALDCRKRLYLRRSMEPSCSNFFHYIRGNRCAFDYNRFFFSLVLVFLFAILCYRTLMNAPILNISNK